MRKGGTYKQAGSGQVEQTHEPAPDPKHDEAAVRRAESEKEAVSKERTANKRSSTEG